MQAVILAAGKGKRLHPITATRTKAMAPILGLPIVERVIEPFIEQGINDIVLVTSPDDDEIRAHFGKGRFQHLEINLVEQPKPLGMAHALSQAIPLIHGDFVLSSCDNLVPNCDIQNVLSHWDSEPRARAILTLLPVPTEALHRVGVVELDGEWIKQIIEKPGPEKAPSKIASTPLYCFQQEFLKYVSEVQPSPRGEYELQEAIQMLIENEGHVRGVHINSRIDLTTPEDLLAINRHFFTQGYAICHSSSLDTRFLPPYHIETGVTFGVNCSVGPNVYIERDCLIGENVRVENAVILRERIVPRGSHIRDQVYY